MIFILKIINHGRDFQVKAVGRFSLGARGRCQPGWQGLTQNYRGIEWAYFFTLVRPTLKRWKPITSMPLANFSLSKWLLRELV